MLSRVLKERGQIREMENFVNISSNDCSVNSQDNFENQNKSQSLAQARVLTQESEVVDLNSSENPIFTFNYIPERDSCQNPSAFSKNLSKLEPEQLKFLSKSSSVSIPVMRISQEDWPGSVFNRSFDHNQPIIPSLTTRKIRQILMASRRSNSGQLRFETGGLASNHQSKHNPALSIKSIDSISENSTSFRSFGISNEEGGRARNNSQICQNHSNLNSDHYNNFNSSIDSQYHKAHQKSGSFASSSTKRNHKKHQGGSSDLCFSHPYISQGQCHMDILKEEIQLMEQLEQGVLLFNNSPEEGISYLIEHELIEDDPLYIANFILHTDFLDKRKVGELLGGHSNLSLSILNNYVHLFNTNSFEPDVALRYFLSRFFLPGESQMVYRILERFSVSYIRDNPTTLYTSDQIHTLCYALVMLNTSLHNPHVRTKMSKQEFITMCMHSNLPATSAQLENMYDRVAENELKPLLSPSEKVYGRLSRDPKVLRSKQVSQVSPTLLQKGTIFRRFLNKNSSHIIIAWISSDSKLFCWKKVRSKSSHLLNPSNFVSNISPQLNKLVNYNKKRLFKPPNNNSIDNNKAIDSNPFQRYEAQSESQSCILTNYSRIANKIRRAFGMDISDLSCILLDDIMDINVGVSSKIHLDRKSSKILRKGTAGSTFSCKNNASHLQSDLESKCFSIITRSGESINLCSLDSTFPSLLIWVRFFHQTILKNQETKETKEAQDSNVMTVYGIPVMDKGIESDLLRVWHHGIFIQWENHWSLNSFINLCNTELPNAASFSNKEVLSSNQNSNSISALLDLNQSGACTDNNPTSNLLQEIVSGQKENLSSSNGSRKTKQKPKPRLKMSPKTKNMAWIQKKENESKVPVQQSTSSWKLKNIFGFIKLKKPKYAPPSHNLHNKYINYQAPISNLILQLWVNNIPCSYRGILWNIAVGNKLQIQASTFNHLLRLRSHFLTDMSDLNNTPECGEKQMRMHVCMQGGPLKEAFFIHLKRFHKDISNVFPELHSFFIGAGAVLGYRIWDRMRPKRKAKYSKQKQIVCEQSDSSFIPTPSPLGTLSPTFQTHINQRILENEEDSELESVLMFFNDNPSIYRIDQSTKILVECFILYRPDIGYVEGMSHIAMILLLFNINLMEAFKTFTNLLHSSFFLDMFMLNHRNVKMRLDFFDMLFKELMPSLAYHFDLLSITSDTYLISWLTSLFSTCIPIQVIPKVWDSLFLFGEPYAFQVALGVLKYHEHKLIMTSFEGCISILHSIPPTFDYIRFNRTLEQFNGIISHRFGLRLAAQRLSEQKMDLMEELF
ncbi:protein with sec7 TBC domains [Cryptosporidium sp. chipmunk genotype I]|uniref:protein with sec7 TBC domains n=1 Tax=Cryptosporidium sp. chipmunk genotype I TaxID=1280935 RepID=UPI00351A3783|nr:protein with sec7 TBC domains [Cryptosporidium sp. chipmunk genotype I]